MLSDTHPDIEELHLHLLRHTPPWRKAHMLGQMFMTVKQLAYQGLRQRHPQAGESELRRRLAALLLGELLAEQIYGPLIMEDKSHAD
jgi:hypothetical protein